MNWSILFCGGGHINKQAAFFLFVLDNDVCFVGLYLTSCQYLQDCDFVSLVPRPVRAIRVTRVGLEPSATVWGSCSYHFSFPALWKLLSYVKILNWKKYIVAYESLDCTCKNFPFSAFHHSDQNRPFALRGHVTSFLWKWKLYVFASEKRLVGHILNKIIVISFFKPAPFS